MRSFISQPVSLVASLTATAFTLLFLCAAPARAQGTKETVLHPTTTGPSSQPGVAPPSIRERQFRINEMEREISRPPTPEERERANAQVAEDYRHIQIINNKMMGAAMRAAVPDYESIADTTAEIGKRASRLRLNLPLPAPNQKEKEAEAKARKYERVADAAQLKAALRTLDDALMSFVNSPVFTKPDVVNVEQAAKARRDLDTVIELSRLIGKDAERLGKSTAK